MAVYFIQDAVNCFIKIGSATDVYQRLRALQCGNPRGLALLAAVDGDAELERALHIRFAASRVQNEWFRPTPDLVLYILAHYGGAA